MKPLSPASQRLTPRLAAFIWCKSKGALTLGAAYFTLLFILDCAGRPSALALYAFLGMLCFGTAAVRVPRRYSSTCSSQQSLLRRVLCRLIRFIIYFAAAVATLFSVTATLSVYYGPSSKESAIASKLSQAAAAKKPVLLLRELVGESEGEVCATGYLGRADLKAHAWTKSLLSQSRSLWARDDYRVWYLLIQRPDKTAMRLELSRKGDFPVQLAGSPGTSSRNLILCAPLSTATFRWKEGEYPAYVLSLE